MDNNRNVVSMDEKKDKKEGFGKKVADTAKDVTDKTAETFKESAKAVNNVAKTFRYETKKRTDALLHMIDKAENKAEREDVRKHDFKKTCLQYGCVLGGLGLICATKLGLAYINKDNAKLS